MEAREIENNLESNEKRSSDEKNIYFKKWQGILLIVSTLVISLVGGYIISDKFFWSNAESNRLNEQLAYYKELVKEDPANPEHRVNLGYTYYLLNNNDEAIKQLLVSLDHEEDFPSAYLNLGIVYHSMGRYDDSLKQSQKLLKLAPRDFNGYLLAGMTYRELKMYDEALESLQEANELMPANTDIITEIGRLAEDQGKLEEAEQIYKEALNYDPLYKPATEALERIAANR